MEFLKSLHRMYFTMKLLANYNESSIEMAFKKKMCMEIGVCLEKGILYSIFPSGSNAGHSVCILYTHSRTRVYTCVYTYICVKIYTYAYIYTHIYACTYAYKHAHIHTHTRAHTHTCTYTHMHTHTHARTHICTHTHMHIHTQIRV